MDLRDSFNEISYIQHETNLEEKFYKIIILLDIATQSLNCV